MKTKLLLIIFLMNIGLAIGQSSFRLSANASFVCKSSDVRGLMLLGGHTVSNINYYRIAKFDYYGNKLWDKYISDFPYYYSPGDTNIEITVHNTLLTECKGGYLFASYIDSSVFINDSTNYQAFSWDSLQFIKLDSSGNLLWRKFYDFPVTYPYQLSVAEDAKGNFLAMSKYYMLKTDSGGNTLWCINIQDTSQQAFYYFDVSPSNKIIIAGTDNINRFLIQLDEDGNFLAARRFNTGLSKKVTGVVANHDGYYLSIDNGPGNACALLIKTDSMLNMSWSKTFGVNLTSICLTVLKNKNNNPVVDILYNTAPANYYYSHKNALCSINSDGTVAEMNCSLYDSVDCAACFVRNVYYQFDIKPDADNGYLYLRQFSHEDNHYPWFSYNYSFIDKNDDVSDSTCFYCSPPPLITTPASILSNTITENIYKWYPASVTLGLNLTDVNYNYSRSCLEYVGISEPAPQGSDIIIFPNPASGAFAVKSSIFEINRIEIFNALGGLVFSEKFSMVKTFEVQKHLPMGIYLVRINSGEKIFLKKLIIQ